MQKVHTCYPFHYGITCHKTAKNHYKGGQLTELSSLYNNSLCLFVSRRTCLSDFRSVKSVVTGLPLGDAIH